MYTHTNHTPSKLTQTYTQGYTHILLLLLGISVSLFFAIDFSFHDNIVTSINNILFLYLVRYLGVNCRFKFSFRNRATNRNVFRLLERNRNHITNYNFSYKIHNTLFYYLFRSYLMDLILKYLNAFN